MFAGLGTNVCNTKLPDFKRLQPEVNIYKYFTDLSLTERGGLESNKIH